MLPLYTHLKSDKNHNILITHSTFYKAYNTHTKETNCIQQLQIHHKLQNIKMLHMYTSNKIWDAHTTAVTTCLSTKKINRLIKAIEASLTKAQRHTLARYHTLLHLCICGHAVNDSGFVDEYYTTVRSLMEPSLLNIHFSYVFVEGG